MRSVETTININVSPDKIIQAFIDEKMLKGWWGVERSLIELKEGGVYTVCWGISEKGFGYVSTGIIKTYKPDGFLEIDRFVYMNPERSLLGPMNLIVSAKQTQNKDISEAHICQNGYQKGEDWDWYYEAVKNAWPIVANNLKSYLEALS